MFKIAYAFCLLALCALPIEVQAYIGPGLGAGAIGVVVGLFTSIFLAIFAIFWYPIKRILKRIKKKNVRSDKDSLANVDSSSENR